MKYAKHNGFSLIELVIVIAMIAIIAAIAIPGIKAAICSANEASAIAAVRIISQAENTKGIASGSYVSLGQLRLENMIDQRFGGTEPDSMESVTNSYTYKITLINMPDGGRDYVLSAIPSITNFAVRTGTRRFGISKTGVLCFDATNYFTHYESLEEMENCTPVGEN